MGIFPFVFPDNTEYEMAVFFPPVKENSNRMWVLPFVDIITQTANEQATRIDVLKTLLSDKSGVDAPTAVKLLSLGTPLTDFYTTFVEEPIN